MGYKYKKVDNRNILVEGPTLETVKLKFLRRYLQLPQEDVTFIYLDGTWIYQRGPRVKKWVFEGNRRGMPNKIIASEGKRFTLPHAGDRSSFL